MAFAKNTTAPAATQTAAATTSMADALSQSGFKPSGTGRSLMGMLATNTLMSGNTGSATLSQLKKAIDTILAGLNKAITEVTVIPMDHEQGSNTYYSGLLIVVNMPSVEKLTAVGYHYLMLAGTRDLPKGQILTEQNVKFESLITPGDLCDAKLVEKLVEKVKMAYPKKAPMYSGCTVVPGNFDYTSEAAVQRLVSSAINACGSELNTKFNLTDRIKFGADIIMDATPEISLNLARNDPNAQTSISGADGQPIRADMNLVSVLRREAPNGGSFNGEQSIVTSAKITGYMDVLYSPSAQPQGMFFGSPAQVNTRCLSPYYVITDMQTDVGYNANTLALAFDSVLALATNSRFMQAFLPSPGQVNSKKNRIDTRNVGALNVLANIQAPGQAATAYGPVLSVTDAGFTDEKMMGYLSSVFRNDSFNVAIDCPVNGSQSWVFSMIDDAARGAPAAMTRFLDSVNELTGGAFNSQFDRSKPVFLMNEVILAGTYLDNNDVRRDLRDIDLMYVCATYGGGTNGNPSEINSWMKTFAAYNNGSASKEMCLHGRRAMIMAMTQDRAHITGTINRHFLSGDFLVALRASLNAVKYNPRIVHQMSTMDFNNVRVSADFVTKGVPIGAANFGTVSAQGYTPVMGNAQSFRTY